MLDEAIEISEALLMRNPDSPQSRYHIAVASFLKCQALGERSQGNAWSPTSEELEEFEKLRKRSLEEMILARESEEAQRIQYRHPPKSPFLLEDDTILNLLRHPSFDLV